MTPSQEEARPPTDRARILVIDDEEAIVRALVRMLRAHDVVGETDPRAAVARIASGESFDLILCDLMMPHLNGIEVHAEIATKAPALIDRLVFLTGGAFTASAMSFLASIPNPHVEKSIGPRAPAAFVADRLQPMTS